MGHMEALKKKELVLAVCVMSREEFDQLVAARNEAAVVAMVWGNLGAVGGHDG